MNKLLKVILYIFIIILLSLLLSPFISLILPEKLTNRTYFRLLYHVIADKEIADVISKEEKARKIFEYVVDHTFLQGIPYECKPAQSLMYGEAYCDFQARVLNALLGAVGIKSRYIVLFDRTGISPHTTAEVFLDGKWRVFDPSLNIIFQDKQGNKLTLEDLSANPKTIYQQEKLVAWKDYDPGDYQAKVVWLVRMFPLPSPPERSTPVVFQAHLFDRIADTYYKVFKQPFFNSYQDLYLFFKKRFAKDDFRTFFKARNYHLAYRQALALEYYNRLLEKHPESEYAQDVFFFRGMLYFERKDLANAKDVFNFIISEKYPYSSKWKMAAYYYLGKIYGLEGKQEESLNVYQHADALKLSAKVMQDLSQRRK